MSKQRIACLAFLVLTMVSLPAFAGASRSASVSTEGAPSFFASWHQPKIIQNKDGCTASLTCPSGAFISCASGVPGTCTAGGTYVICNGVRTDCPACTAERDCCDGSSVYCEGNTCSLTARGVKCDGIIYTCGRCPILP